MVMLTLTATLIIPLLAIAAAMKLHDHRQSARWSRKRKSRAGRCWMRLAPELAKAAPSDVCTVRLGPPRTFGFFRPESCS
jgi:hypothetical protein